MTLRRSPAPDKVSAGAALRGLATALNMSLSSASQMIDRLHQLELLTRVEMAEDRRRTQIALTRRGKALLQRLRDARSEECELGLAALSGRSRTALRSEQALRNLAGAQEGETA